MSGPRVTSGKGSKQDYQSPINLLEPVQSRFGPIIFDLAAHRLNKVHKRYFAPPVLTATWDPKKAPQWGELAESLVARGADPDRVDKAIMEVPPRPEKAEIQVPNQDPDAFGFDAFTFTWAHIHKAVKDGILWLNCEFNQVTPWARKCQLEAAQGAHILLLTPMVLTDWYVRHVAGSADVYQLSGRVSFDGKHPFPKDCMISHFHPKATGALAIWDWRQDRILERWSLG